MPRTNLFNIYAFMAKLEGTPGTPETLTPGVDAMELINGTFEVVQNTEDNPVARPYDAAPQKINTIRYGRFSGQINLVGNATAGMPAPADALWRSCRYARVDTPGPPAYVEYVAAQDQGSTITFASFRGGERFELTGARGRVTSFAMGVGIIPRAGIEGAGKLSVDAVEAAPPVGVDTSGFQLPLAGNEDILTSTWDGNTMGLYEVNVEDGGSLVYSAYAGGFVVVSRRSHTGNILILPPTNAEFNLRQAVKDMARGTLVVNQHLVGATVKSVKMTLPGVQLGEPSYEDKDGLDAWRVPFSVTGTSTVIGPIIQFAQ